MKIYLALLSAALAAGCSKPDTSAVDTVQTADATKPTAADMGMSATEHEQMSNTDEAPAAGTSATATGTVDGIDAAAGTITISHGAVESLKWPAMTMAFKATPEQVASVQAGQKVSFEFTSEGMDGTITTIRSQ